MIMSVARCLSEISSGPSLPSAPLALSSQHSSPTYFDRSESSRTSVDHHFGKAVLPTNTYRTFVDDGHRRNQQKGNILGAGHWRGESTLWIAVSIVCNLLGLHIESHPRFLTDEDDVWSQNAWDHVPPPDDQGETIAKSLSKQRSNPVPVEEKQKYNEKPAKHW